MECHHQCSYKQFLNLIDLHFPKLNKLHKIFNRNTAKVGYWCTENLSIIIKTHNNKVTNVKITPKDQCICRNKNICPLDSNYLTSDIICKCIVSSTVNTDIVYLGAAKGYFKKRYYNHKKSFNNRKNANDTTLSKCVWEVRDTYKETPSIKWSIVKSVPGYSNITNKCLLCHDEKLEIINYPNQEDPTAHYQFIINLRTIKYSNVSCIRIFSVK